MFLLEPIVIVMEGGVIHHMSTCLGRLPVPVCVFDLDTEGADPDDVEKTPWGDAVSRLYLNGEPLRTSEVNFAGEFIRTHMEEAW